jgi:putative hydrolase of the HAD superfamily
VIKHISFDLWLTLIKSHPEFKEKRAEFLKKEFNPNANSISEIKEIVQETDKICDRLNEMSGRKVPVEAMYRRILLKLGYNHELITDDLLYKIKLHVNDLFMNFQPIFLNNSILSMLRFFKKDGYNLSISSNTGYIEGNVLTATFSNLNIASYFEFCIFSDEIGASKPSSLFFDKVFDRISAEKEEVLHIGDNYKADYEGAMRYGFKALHINNQHYTINDIKRHLQKNY